MERISQQLRVVDWKRKEQNSPDVRDSHIVCIHCVFIKVINPKHTGEVRNGILNLLKIFKNKVLRNQALKSYTHDPKPVGLPDDFDINTSIPTTVAEALKRVLLSMDCHNYIKQVEEKRAKLTECT